MSEANTNNAVEEVKIYKFRRLSSEDIFPMLNIFGKIGVNKFAECLGNGNIAETFAKLSGNGGSDESTVTVMGITVVLEIANIITSNIHKCESDIYQLLSQTSNLSVEEIKKLDAVVFLEMVIDFIKKEEFKDFIKVVSKLFK